MQWVQIPWGFKCDHRDWGCKLKLFLPSSCAFLFMAGGYTRDQPSVLFCLQPLLHLSFTIMGISKSRSIVCASLSSWVVHAHSLERAYRATPHHTDCGHHPGCWMSARHHSQMSRNLADHPTGRAVTFHWVQVVAGRQGSWHSLGAPSVTKGSCLRWTAVILSVKCLLPPIQSVFAVTICSMKGVQISKVFLVTVIAHAGASWVP